MPSCRDAYDLRLGRVIEPRFRVSTVRITREKEWRLALDLAHLACCLDLIDVYFEMCCWCLGKRLVQAFTLLGVLMTILQTPGVLHRSQQLLLIEPGSKWLWELVANCC